jgi:hypothetical protein
MVRVILLNLLLFLLPTILYAAFKAVRVSLDGKELGWDFWDGLPLVPLFAAGVVLVAGTLIYFASVSEPNVGKSYVPPSYEDGKLVPGQVK